MRKIIKYVEKVMYLLTSGFAAMGVGALLCKILKEDAWSWKNWSMSHKVIYWILSIVITLPIVLYIAYYHVIWELAFEDDVFDEE